MTKLKLIHLKDQILDFVEKGFGPTEISKLLNEDVQCVRSVIFKFRGKIKFKQSVDNDDYFENINNKSKAYILGYLFADGALVDNGNGSKVLTITLHRKDVCFLEFLKKELGLSHKIQTIKQPSSFDKSKTTDHVRISFANKRISTALNKLGFHERKTFSIGNVLENITYEFRDSFILGYFDGDGSVSLCNQKKSKFVKKENKIKTYDSHSIHVSFKGTELMFIGFCNHLNISKNHIKKYVSIHSLSFSSKKDVSRFYKCYEGLPFFLERKKDKFLERINHHSFDKYK